MDDVDHVQAGSPSSSNLHYQRAALVVNDKSRQNLHIWVLEQSSNNCCDVLIGKPPVKTNVDLPGFDCRGQSIAERIVPIAQPRLRRVAVLRCVRKEVYGRVV